MLPSNLETPEDASKSRECRLARQKGNIKELPFNLLPFPPSEELLSGKKE